MSQIDLQKKFNENQKKADEERVEFLTSTMFTEPLHADWNKWKQFAMMHETCVFLGVTPEFYKELFSSTTTEYNLHRVGVMLSAMERRTLWDWTVVNGPQGINSYFEFITDVERVTLLFNPIVEEKQDSLNRKVQALNALHVPKKPFQA